MTVLPANICQGPTGAITALSTLPGSPLFTSQHPVVPALYRWGLQHTGQLTCPVSLDGAHDYWPLSATETPPILHPSAARFSLSRGPVFHFCAPCAGTALTSVLLGLAGGWHSILPRDLSNPSPTTPLRSSPLSFVALEHFCWHLACKKSISPPSPHLKY